MTEILVQPELQSGWLADSGLSTTISGMARTKSDDSRRGAYLRIKSKEPSEPINNFIRQWREQTLDEHGEPMTQETLAELSGLSVGSISAYERGGTNPSMDALQRLSGALKVPRGALLEVNPDDDPPLWAGFLRASKAQKEQISRIVGALVAPPKVKR